MPAGGFKLQPFHIPHFVPPPLPSHGKFPFPHWIPPPLPAGIKIPPFHFPWMPPKVGGSDDGTAEKCWAPLTEVNNCVNEVYTSFVTRKNSFSLYCCSVVKKLSSHKVCHAKTIGAFDDEHFSTSIHHHCSNQVAPPPTAV
ncbi:hypothetical protein RJ640_008641 [Escallonia rubra]|uniref:Prolamin-like domain-containing protein n=1 Tax=Escallonia rubra TaxID=112253 RepID=A0AA88RL06_9ASTE|nr:hypothetical protein RJ640_008641 [Escallonia rubra]